MTAGLYIHVPFCRRKCPYCDFYSIPARPGLLEAYTDAVCRNLECFRDGTPIDTVYFGGGTPSLLSPAQAARILEKTAACFALSSDAEITLEANPATVTAGQLKELYAVGVNRLSIGVQSLEENQLQRLGRLHSVQEAVTAVEWAVNAGFSNLSCDLMLALPDQTGAELERTITALTALPIQHISAYLLKIEPGTPFAAQHMETHCPDADEAADLYLRAVELLERQGFFQYEISNFSRPGFQSRHNLKYWRCAPYLGIGSSAHSCWHGKRFLVPSDVDEFLRQPRQTMCLEDDAPCTREEQILLGMRLTEGVPAAWLAAHQARVEQFCQAGYLRRQGDRIAFTPKGFLVSNSILAELI